MYSQTRVTVRPRAMPQAAFSGAPARIIWSAASKSSRKLNAARPMQTSEKMIASGPPVRRPRPSPPPTLNIAEHEVAQHQDDHADHAGDQHPGELRRDPDGAGLVDDEHAEEHADGAEDRLADQRTGAGAGNDEVGEHERQRAEEQALERRVGQHDRRVVLLAAERGDHHERQAAEPADERERRRQSEVARDQEVGDDGDRRTARPA